MAQVLRIVRENNPSNTHFEGGTTGWSSFGTPATFAQSATQKHSGQYALRIVGQTDTPRGGYTDVAVLPSTTYHYAVWYYLVSGTFKLQADGDATGNLVNNVSVSGTGAWTQLITTFTTGATDTSVRLYILTTTATAEGYFDDVRLYQQLVTLQDVTDFGLREMSEAQFGQPMGSVRLSFDALGSSISDMLDNLIAFGRALILAKQNRDALWRNAYYQPVFLQWMPPNSTYMLQTEVLGLTPDSDGSIEKIISQPQLLLSNRIENLTVPLLTRGYWAELTPVAVAGSPFTSDNATGTMTLTGLRGDLSRQPLRIKVRSAAASQTSIIAAIKAQGKVANFIHHFDLNSAAGTGYSVTHNATFTADQNDADDFVNGKGARVTPTTAMDTAAEISRLTTLLITSNTADFTGRFRALLRMRDNHATTPKASIRVRSILVNASATVLYRGDFWTTAQQAQVTATTGGVPQPLLDCGVGNLPATSLGGAAPYQMGIEIWGYTSDTSVTFDLDELFLFPVSEGDDCGMAVGYLPTALGTGAIPDGVIDAHDRTTDAYIVDASDVILAAADNTAGVPLYAYPNISQTLLVTTRRRSNGTQPHGSNLTVTVDYTPRYRLARGS